MGNSCWKRVFAMTSVFSWKNSVSLCPASFCTPKPNSPVTPGILNSYFCIPVICDEKNIFFFCQFQKVLQVIIEPFNFRLFRVSGWCIDLDHCDIEWFVLELNSDHSIIFEIAPKNFILDSFVDYEGNQISSKGFLPTVVDIMII